MREKTYLGQPDQSWHRQYRLVSLALVCVASSANAQLNITSRNTTQRYGYVHGGGPDVHSADVIGTTTALVGSDTQSVLVSDSTSGQFFGHSWDTSVAADLFQEYGIAGPLNDASSITCEEMTSLSCSAFGDIGVASMQSNNPGNSLEFHFNVAQDIDYHLGGSIFGGSSGFSYVALQWFDGVTWASDFLSFAIPGQDITWDVSGLLVSGREYRLIGALDDGVGGNQSHTKTLDYNFRAGRVLTPEPVTASLGVASAALFLRRRRQK